MFLYFLCYKDTRQTVDYRYGIPATEKSVGLDQSKIFGPKCGLLRIQSSGVLNLFDMNWMKLSTPALDPSSGCNNCVSNKVGHSDEWWKKLPNLIFELLQTDFCDFSGKKYSLKVEKMLSFIKKIQIQFIFTLATQNNQNYDRLLP